MRKLRTWKRFLILVLCLSMIANGSITAMADDISGEESSLEIADTPEAEVCEDCQQTTCVCEPAEEEPVAEEAEEPAEEEPAEEDPAEDEPCEEDPSVEEPAVLALSEEEPTEDDPPEISGLTLSVSSPQRSSRSSRSSSVS